MVHQRFSLTNLADCDSILSLVKVHWLNLVILLWLGWYIAGPMAEVFDYWDPPRQEFHDLTNNAGGGIALVAAVFGLGMAAARKWSRVRTPVSRAIRRRSDDGRRTASALPAAFGGSFLSVHSPPLPLRI